MVRRELMCAPAVDPGHVVDELSRHYSVRLEPASSHSWTYLDTFDWRLHRAEMTLRATRHGSSGELVLAGADVPRVTVNSRAHTWPRRIDRLAASPVRDRLSPVVGVRALLPRAEVLIRSIPVRLLDAEEKTRVRLRIDQQRVAGASPVPLPLHVVVEPLRGYERDAQRCVDVLVASVGAVEGPVDAATAAMTAAGHRPGQPAVVRIPLDPNAPAVESLTLALRGWMDVIDSTAPGVIDDVDLEYVHELRGAVQATRSLFELAGDLLPAVHAERFTSDFGWLGGLITDVRSLDVHLLQLDDVAAALPADLQPLRRVLVAERRRAWRALRDALQSRRVHELGNSWRRALDRVSVPDLPGPSTSVVAAEQAGVAYRRIVKLGADVTSDTPSVELDRVRRRCKKLRHLLDDYASVFAPQPRQKVRNTLQKVVTTLDDIHDLAAQGERVTRAAVLLHRRAAPTETLLSMGALRERLLQGENAARHDLVPRLRRFAAKPARDDVAALAVPSA